MIKMRAAISLLLMASMLCSCSKEKPSPTGQIMNNEAGPSENTQAPADAVIGRAPEIISAALYPEAPNAASTLTLQYEGRGADDPVQYTFRWFVDDRIVQEGPDSTLPPGAFKKGSVVYAEITPSTVQTAGKPFKTLSRMILNQPPVVTSIVLEPIKPVIGDVIAASPDGTDPDGDTITYRYQWTVNGELVPNMPPESSTLNTRGMRKKDRIAVVVAPSDPESQGRLVVSPIIPLGNSAPRIESLPGTSLVNGVFSYQVKAVDPDGDSLAYTLITAPRGMTIERSSGLVRWEPPIPSEKQEVPVKIMIDDGDGGSITQTFSLMLEPSGNER